MTKKADYYKKLIIIESKCVSCIETTRGFVQLDSVDFSRAHEFICNACYDKERLKEKSKAVFINKNEHRYI